MTGPSFKELSILAKRYSIPTTKRNKDGKYGKTNVTIRVLKSRLTRASIKYSNHFGARDDEYREGKKPMKSSKTIISSISDDELEILLKRMPAQSKARLMQTSKEMKERIERVLSRQDRDLLKLKYPLTEPEWYLDHKDKVSEIFKPIRQDIAIIATIVVDALISHGAYYDQKDYKKFIKIFNT